MAHLSGDWVMSARWNIPIVTLPDREEWGWEKSGRWRLPPAEPRLNGQIAFITDGRAVSYAESVMGIVEAYGLGEIVGATTAGTNGNINPFELPGGYTVIWTGMKVLKHDGSQHHGVGIAPTVPIEPTAKGIAEGRDEVLEKAVEVLQEKIAAGGGG
jgi:C-terminal processing protease CtpA/Prc